MGIEADGAAWSPYVVGALIGVLSMATFYFSDKAIGASSFYATLAGAIGKVIAMKIEMSRWKYAVNARAQVAKPSAGAGTSPESAPARSSSRTRQETPSTIR